MQLMYAIEMQVRKIKHNCDESIAGCQIDDTLINPSHNMR